MIFFLANSTCGKWQTLRGGPKFTTILFVAMFVAMFVANIYRPKMLPIEERGRVPSTGFLSMSYLYHL